MKIGRFLPSFCVAVSVGLPALAAPKGQEKGNVSTHCPDFVIARGLAFGAPPEVYTT
jgi:hypothetical protein